MIDKSCLTNRLLRKGYLLFLFTFLWMGGMYASHNLAGEITYNYLGNNEVEIVLTTYTDPSAAGVDRCEVDMELWNSNGTIKVADLLDIKRSNGQFQNDPVYPNLNCPNAFMGEYLFGSVKMNIYKVRYRFNGPGFYLVRFTDHARLDNIKNMVQSGTQTFFLETNIFINSALGVDNSPRFLNHPLDFACIDKIWTHNPGGYDPDGGDSLVWSLVACRQYDPPAIATPAICSGYTFPDDPIHGNSSLTIDSETGLITWDAPRQIGIYNIAYKVEQYRNGIFIGNAYRDMAIWVKECDNEPPVIETIEDTCVYANDTLQFGVVSYDPDFYDDSLYFHLNNGSGGNNGPFAVTSNPATLTFVNQPVPVTYPIDTTDTVRGTFTWITDCSHLRSQFYQVDFYAHDNLSYLDVFGAGQSTGFTQTLGTHKVVKIRVIPRPVTGLVAQAQGGSIALNWDPHNCSSALGYEIYRRIGQSGWQQDSICCDQSPASAGYTKLGTTTGHGSTNFIDNTITDAEIGAEICYLVVATFPGGQKSCASNEFCLQIDKFRPALTNASVTVTSGTAGEMFVSWTQPDRDTTGFFVEPYTYTLYRANEIIGNSAFTVIGSNLAFNDTTFIDQGIDTDSRGYRYRVEVYDANAQLIAEGNEGSSVYLTLNPGDEEIQLSWSEYVPWSNSMYYIYRSQNFSGPWALIDSVPGTGRNTHTYLDTGLENFQEYCYYVSSYGGYSAPDIKFPLINDSEVRCGTPTDLTPPCINPISYDTLSDCKQFTVRLNWQNIDSLCAGDLVYHTIYIAEGEGQPFTEIGRVDTSQNGYVFNSLQEFPDMQPSIAYCFGITATDSLGNESEMLIWCFDNCPVYEIENVFTPNGDGANEYFGIFRDRAYMVQEVMIYDRWGSVVYSSNSVSNPDEIWDGRNNNGQEAPEGVYYYYIRFNEDRLVGDFPRPPIVGWVTLLR